MRKASGQENVSTNFCSECRSVMQDQGYLVSDLRLVYHDGKLRLAITTFLYEHDLTQAGAGKLCDLLDIDEPPV